MVDEPVGGHALVDRGERVGVLAPPTSTRHPAGGIDDDPAVGDEASRDQRTESEHRCGHVAAGGRDEPSPRELGSVHLWKPVDSALNEFGMAVLEAVVARIRRDVSKPEGG